jgi:hypothetical protein
MKHMEGREQAIKRELDELNTLIREIHGRVLG